MSLLDLLAPYQYRYGDLYAGLSPFLLILSLLAPYQYSSQQDFQSLLAQYHKTKKLEVLATLQQNKVWVNFSAKSTEVALSLSISQPNTGSPKMDQNLTGSQLQHGSKPTLGRVTIQIDKVLTEGLYSGMFSLSHDGGKDSSRTLEIEIVWSNRTFREYILAKFT
ncbi:hypothetical protein FCM35_KLT15930 [Carex littledalei]|uniref:Uncharacterized protein n=1 Tax=Carex littledalei TaxID=544730 RepID=A0A833RWJ5_9POAL|nr:hypothetical protein FCM35_KLT15930 [Carex littledalei]